MRRTRLEREDSQAAGTYTSREILDWLFSGDVSVQYRTRRDLLGEREESLAALRARIPREGWGRRFLEARDAETKMWGGGLYIPKWVSTHYTLLDLMALGTPGEDPRFRESVELILERFLYSDGGINVSKTGTKSDVCVSAMALSLALYAGLRDDRLQTLMDYLARHRQPDGGWNCEDCVSDVSSFATTISVLEALDDARKTSFGSEADLIELSRGGQEWLLSRRLFFRLQDGTIANPEFPYLSFPCRWKYDILRALSYFAKAKRPYDTRMAEALSLLKKKRRADGTWPVQRKHPGAVHFDMEATGGPSRWNTLRALIVLKAYGDHEPGSRPRGGNGGGAS